MGPNGTSAMSSITKKIAHWLKVACWRVIAKGVAIPPADEWKLLVAGLCWISLLVLFSAIYVDPESEVWRAYLGLVLILTFIFVLLPGWLLVFYGYYNRDAIDPDIIKKYANESLDLGRSAKIGIACAVAGPPTIRYILSLFGWEL